MIFLEKINEKKKERIKKKLEIDPLNHGSKKEIKRNKIVNLNSLYKIC